jgi:hypothetical protein
VVAVVGERGPPLSYLSVVYAASFVKMGVTLVSSWWCGGWNVKTRVRGGEQLLLQHWCGTPEQAEGGEGGGGRGCCTPGVPQG